MKNVELVEYYEKKQEEFDWTIEQIIKFEEKIRELSEEDFEEIEGFNDSGYGEWRIETGNCDSWGGFDNEIEKLFCKSIVDLANDASIDWIHSTDNEDGQVIYSYDKFCEYLDRSDYQIYQNGIIPMLVKKGEKQ